MPTCNNWKYAIRFNPNLYADGKVCLFFLETQQKTGTHKYRLFCKF